MTQLREFAQRSADFDKLGVLVVALSVDDQEHTHRVWEEAAQRKFTILSDPGAKVINYMRRDIGRATSRFAPPC